MLTISTQSVEIHFNFYCETAFNSSLVALEFSSPIPKLGEIVSVFSECGAEIHVLITVLKGSKEDTNELVNFSILTQPLYCNAQ